ncbi:dihydrofolate reductase [Nonlabens spongiae]|uniref:Dihydrofolate reductase n=1 Tax=Nonlabens spongiae TaxID=331648 RepID=A0A1W6MIL5_9FLAO|nr:dihydrofolate reductase [Nonlabens spongiae]ARN77432.1 dihydrofolate reductase [Nonlabens spongiae]
MKNMKIAAYILAATLMVSCNNSTDEPITEVKAKTEKNNGKVTEFADIAVLHYEIPGWDELSLKQQQLVYYMTQAGLSGRDITWDQNYRHNLAIRQALENLYTNYKGDKESEAWQQFETYLNRVWFASGIHHHYSMDKMIPELPKEQLSKMMEEAGVELDTRILNLLYDDQDSKKVVLDEDKDLVLASAVNLYGPDVTTQEAKEFYGSIAVDKNEPIEVGLNSRLVKKNGELVEEIYKSGGKYGAAIDRIIYWLEKAQGVAETEAQEKALGLLIEYYKTGSLDTWDDYAIAWTNSTDGAVDWINGFIEVYNDPIAYKGSYESIVQIKDFDMSRKMEVLSKNAQWFEDHSPLMDEHKKDSVKGVSYKTVNVAGEAGDASPATPIGVNLPNNVWIRNVHGSKSVSLGNIIAAYNGAGSTGKLEEFAHDEEEIELEKKYGALADKLHTALHEVVGHASGQINPGVGTPKETLGSYKSTIEEGRADLFGLYYLMDPKLEELGLVEDWKKTGMAAYDGYIRNGLMTQLTRLEVGQNVEEAHMRNRQWVSAWAYERGEENGVIEKVTKDGKTYYDIKDYKALREIFGELLRETQRMTSEGDFEAAKALVEDYGVKVDQDIHQEVKDRASKFEAPAYSGFVNPMIVPVEENGEITGFEIKQPDSFAEQMLTYSETYGFLNSMDTNMSSEENTSTN